MGLTIIKAFLTYFSERQYSENVLSDMTWALAKSDKEFMRHFMDMFDFDLNVDHPWEIYRETTDDDSRPDFKIKQDDKIYIIENKIDDRNDHFEQYSKQFPKAKKGIIANYRIDKEYARKYGFECRTWSDFTNLLSRAITNSYINSKDEHLLLIQAYIEYVKEVCVIVALKEMRFDSLVSLYHFNKVLEQTIKPIQGYECSLYNQGKFFGEDYSGRYIYLKRANSKSEVYPWMGICYGNDAPTNVYITFGKDWCSNIYKNYNITEKKYNYAAKPYREDDCLNFEFKEDVLKEFMTTSLERQREILHRFFEEVIRDVGEYI